MESDVSADDVQSILTMRMSCSARPGRAKRSIRRASAAMEDVARSDNRPTCRTVTVTSAAIRLARQAPHGASGSIVQDRAVGAASCVGQSPPIVVGDEPVPGGVGQQDVVVLGEESRGCRSVRVGSARVGQVEQLAAPLVAERPKHRPQTVEHLTHSGQPAPRRHIGSTGRAEGGEVAHHDAVDGRVRLDRPAQPGLRGRVHRLRRAPPDPAGGTWTMARRFRHARASAAAFASGNCSAERPAELMAGARPFLEERAGERDHGLEVDVAQVRGVLPVTSHLLIQHRLDEWPQHQGVVGADQVDRAADDHDPDDGPIPQQLRQRLGVEAGEA